MADLTTGGDSPEGAPGSSCGELFSGSGTNDQPLAEESRGDAGQERNGKDQRCVMDLLNDARPDSSSENGWTGTQSDPCLEGDRTHSQNDPCPEGDRTHPQNDPLPEGERTHPQNDPCPEGDRTHPQNDPCPGGDQTHPEKKIIVYDTAIDLEMHTEVKGHTGTHEEGSSHSQDETSLAEEDEEVIFDVEVTSRTDFAPENVTKTAAEGSGNGGIRDDGRDGNGGIRDDGRDGNGGIRDDGRDGNSGIRDDGRDGNGGIRDDDSGGYGGNGGICDGDRDSDGDSNGGDGHGGDGDGDGRDGDGDDGHGHGSDDGDGHGHGGGDGDGDHGDGDGVVVKSEAGIECGNEGGTCGMAAEGLDSKMEGGSAEDLLVRIALLEKRSADLAAQLAAEREKDTSFQETAKELETKCFHQQERLEELELEGEKRSEQKQQQERDLLLKIDQATKQLEDASRDKTSVIGKLAVLQEEQRRLIDQVTDQERKAKELTKDNDKLDVLVKKQRTEVLKLQGSLEKSEARSSQLTQELAKEKKEVGSLSIKVKWAQNKLKTETEAHKSVRSQLEATAKKLKQAQEEGGQIRADMKQMIQQYQESEDMRSNSLDIKLKKTEEELKQQEQEIADQQDLHDLTVKELDLAKASHKIAQEEVLHHKQKLSELSGRVTELIAEIQELKGTSTKQKQENKKLSLELSEQEQHSQVFEKERVKFSQLRDVFTQLQKSNQHLERELEKRKERELELLQFSEKLSSSNAELTAERSDWEAKVTSHSSERDALSVSLSECEEAETKITEELKALHESSQSEVANLLDRLDGKTKAVEQLSIALEDERELAKAVKKKNSNVIKDLQKQLQSSNRRVENLEASISSEREPPATLPISRTSSHSSLDGVPSASRHTHIAQDTPTIITTTTNENAGSPATISLSDEERVAATPSPDYKFTHMDQEKIMLVEKLCQLKKELVKQEEKSEFFEEHISQLTEDIQGKSKIIQNFIMREQTGALTPPSFDANKIRQVQKGGVMGTVFSAGKNSRAYKMPDVNFELSLEMNRKMQSVLEDTLLKNITLKESIDTLGREIQRISAQLQTYEKLQR